MLKDFLIEIGLSEKEAQVYLALLEVDSDSVSDIAKKTKINRTTVYPVLESLEEKKLVKEVSVKGKTEYMAESPERLETYVEKRKAEFNELENKTHKMIPQFKGIMRGEGERPIVEFQEGRESMIRASKGFFTSEDKDGVSYMIYSRDKVEETFNEKERKTASKERVAKNIETKVIYNYKKGDISGSLGNRIRVSEEEYPIGSQITVYKDRIRIYTYGDSPSILNIKSKDIAQTLVTLFKMAMANKK